MQFTNARLVLPDSIERGSIKLRNGRIAHISRAAKPKRSAKDLNLQGGYLTPGFIDLHIHGAVGRDTMEASTEAFRAITEFHLRGGTTSIALTTVTASEPEILRVLDAAKPLHNKSIGGSRIA